MQIETNVQNGTAQSPSVTLKAKYKRSPPFLYENKKEKEARRAIIGGGGGVLDFSKAEVHENNLSSFLLQYLFLRMGVNLGSKSLIGGVILFMPMTFTIACQKQRQYTSQWN